MSFVNQNFRPPILIKLTKFESNYKDIHMKTFYAVVLSVCVLLFSGSAYAGSDKFNVIYETDIGNDIDDALALDMLYKYHEMGKINFVAVMLNKCDSAPAEYMDINNTWYGYPDMPVGIVRDGSNDPGGLYAQQVVDLKHEDGTPMFKRSHSDYDKLPDAHILYRKLLAQMPDNSVVIASVGFSTNLARLLETPADEYSKLTGAELVKKKVRFLSAMAGDLRKGNRAEYNVRFDIPAAQKVFHEWPTPIVISPFEVGMVIQYPGASIENDFDWANGLHPMIESYKAYKQMPYDRPTWDLTSVLYAAEGAEWFTVSPMGRIEVNDKGSMFFIPDPKADRCYLSVNEEQISRILKRFQEVITSKTAVHANN